MAEIELIAKELDDSDNKEYVEMSAEELWFLKHLFKKFNPKKVYVNFIIELVNEGLNGRAAFDEDIEVTSLIQI